MKWIVIVYLVGGYGVFHTDELRCQQMEARAASGETDQMVGPSGLPELIVRAECLGPSHELVEVTENKEASQ